MKIEKIIKQCEKYENKIDKLIKRKNTLLYCRHRNVVDELKNIDEKIEQTTAKQREFIGISYGDIIKISTLIKLVSKVNNLILEDN